MADPDPLADYAELKREVEAAGFYTSVQPIERLGDRLVCASESREYGLSGVSFWVARRGGEWFIASWGGLIYEVPSGARIDAVAIDILRGHKGTPFDFSPTLKLAHSLRRISGEDFDAKPRG